MAVLPTGEPKHCMVFTTAGSTTLGQGSRLRTYSIALKLLPVTRDSGGSASQGKEEEKSVVPFSITDPGVH